MIATSLIPLDTNLPEIYAFILGFSCTVWTKMRSLYDSLADGMLADAIELCHCQTSNSFPTEGSQVALN